MSTYDFDKTTVIDDYEVNLCTDKLYGCFEDIEDGGEGGLWFNRKFDGTLELIDYDGYYELPQSVIEALIGFGCDVSYVTED
jgi:hypothetical protein